MGGSSDGAKCAATCAIRADAFGVLTLSVGSILGVLARVGVGLLFGPTYVNVTSPESALFLDLPANALGCFVIGVHNAWKDSTHVSFHPAFVLAISTGFAGCLTTFASWNFQVIRMFADGAWGDALFALLIGLYVSMASLHVGLDAGFASIHALSKFGLLSADSTDVHEHSDGENGADDGENGADDGENGADDDVVCSDEAANEEEEPSVLQIVIVAIILAVLLAAAVVGGVLDTDNEVRRSLWTSALFAPIGALGRWQLARLNGRIAEFPLGTFVANILATTFDVILGAALIPPNAPFGSLANTREDWRIPVQSLITGLGGSLSTVSTWVTELRRLKGFHRYRYAVCSIAVAQGVGLLIYGPFVWTRR